MDSNTLIEKILASTTPEEVFNMTTWESEYKRYIILLHPDKCSHPKASEASSILNSYKNNMSEPKYTDDAGTFKLKDNKILFTGEKHLLDRSYRNLAKIKPHMNGPFEHQVPSVIDWRDDDTLHLTFGNRLASITDKTLDEKHVRWIYNKTLSYLTKLSHMGYVHAGITPDSVLVEPEMHGVCIISAYHMKKKGERLTTIPNKYKHWYPASVFSDKTAVPKIDGNLVSRLAFYLLGDKSGHGVKLKGRINDGLYNHLKSEFETMDERYADWQEFLHKFHQTTPKEFYELNL